MKKTIAILVVLVFALMTVTPAFARPHHRHHHSHSWHWGAFGIGVLAGAIVNEVFHSPPRRVHPPRSPRVVVRTPPEVVVRSTPVVVQNPYIITPAPEQISCQGQEDPHLWEPHRIAPWK